MVSPADTPFSNPCLAFIISASIFEPHTRYSIMRSLSLVMRRFFQLARMADLRNALSCESLVISSANLCFVSAAPAHGSMGSSVLILFRPLLISPRHVFEVER